VPLLFIFFPPSLSLSLSLQVSHRSPLLIEYPAHLEKFSFKIPIIFCFSAAHRFPGRMATYLPEEMVVKILSWLPPKSLIRFKCVSKRWHALIGNPDFLSKTSSITPFSPKTPVILAVLPFSSPETNPTSASEFTLSALTTPSAARL
jgi:hypothetical protein